MSPDYSTILENCECTILAKRSRSMFRQMNSALRPHNLTHNQFSILVTAACNPMLIADMADELQMDRTTLLLGLGPLTARGLLDKKLIPPSKKALTISITDAGRVALDGAYRSWYCANTAIQTQQRPALP